MKYKILVLGASGMAGHMISLYMHENGHDVTGFARHGISYCKSVIGDALDCASLKRFIRADEYDAVINCIGILNQSAEDNKSLAILLNSYLPHFLADITSDMPTKIIHMSTDCVFSGRKGGYTETDIKDGASFYDRTKALGELEDIKNLTLRNSIIGPDINPDGIGLLNWFMKAKNQVNGYTNVRWTGLTTLELAKVMEAALEQDAHGLYNMVYNQAITKNDLLSPFNQKLRAIPVEIIPTDTVVCDKSLCRTRFDFQYSVPDYETMIEELACWMQNHRTLYPHYDMRIKLGGKAR